MTPAARPARTLIAFLALAVLLCTPALAQRGPAPGQDPAGYAVAYADKQARQAGADPAGYVQETATVEGVANATAEAGYVACWAAYDATGTAPAPCEGYFTPPGTAQRPAEEQNGTAAQLADGAVAQGGNVTGTAASAAQAIVEDPSSAPSEAERVVAAIGAAVAWLVGAIGGILGSLSEGLGSLASAGAAAMGALGTGLHAGLSGLAGAVAATGTSLASLSSAVASGASVAGRAVADAAAAAGNAIAQAAGATGKAIGDAARTVADAVASFFGASAPAAPQAPALPETGLPAPRLEASGLLDAVAEKVPV